jgi:histidyl-tRNA synthetase
MKASLPKGTRDFGPNEVIKRQYIFDTLKSIFIKYGFMPLETPAMESLSTLTGKYGDEGDKLLFKVLNNGDYLRKADKEALANEDSSALTSSISKRGMRYDLTVPFARYVVMNQNEISFPFKRYQIQPVWRADRPQKGRYQEFYQCDVDVVGSDSLMYEAELMKIYSEAFEKLNIGVKIHINNRKVLFGIAEQVGIADQFMDMTIAIDKMDKIGEEGVQNELLKRGISEETSKAIFGLLKIDNLTDLAAAFTNTAEGIKGIEELRAFHKYFDLTDGEDVQFDITLARGLGYYTGCIFEVKVDTEKHPDVKMGSIGGGGRYDNLTETFGLKGVSGVGMSFGAARIYDVMNELDLFPDNLPLNPAILFVTFDEVAHLYAFDKAQKLRAKGIAADVYPDYGKMKKQIKYADSRGIEYVGIIGDEEMGNKTIMVKNLALGEQSSMTVEELIQKFKK